MDDGSGRVGGSASTGDNIISTQRSNAVDWTPMIGKTPYGAWELALSDYPEIREMFLKEEVSDIILIITYSGELPPWPA